MGPLSSKISPHARSERPGEVLSTMPPDACEGGKGVRGDVRKVFEGREGGDGRIQGGAAGLRLAAFAVREEHMGRAGEWHGELERLPSTPCGTMGGQGGSGLRNAPDHPDLRRCRSGWYPDWLSSTASGPRQRRGRLLTFIIFFMSFAHKRSASRSEVSDMLRTRRSLDAVKRVQGMRKACA